MATRSTIAQLKAELGNAIALQQNGRVVEALAIHRGLHERYANQPSILNALGILSGQAGLVDWALGFLGRAAAMAPRDPLILSNFGSALAMVFNFDLAIDHLERAIGIDPNFEPAWDGLATTLISAGRPEAAVEIARHLKTHNPNHLGTRSNIAQSLMQLGQFDLAEAEAREMISRWPTSAQGYVALAPLVRFQAGDSVLTQAENFLSDGRFAAQEIGTLSFALAKMYDDCGRVSDAFRAFTTANARTSPRYDRKEAEERFKSIAQVFSRDLVSRRHGQGHKSNVPILVVGMPRSGTTLLDSLLTAHREIASVGEVHYLRAVAMSIDGFSQREGDFAGLVQTLAPEAFEFLGHRYVEKLSSHVGDRTKTRIVDKMPHNFTNLGFAALALPAVKIIHVRRSPLATCLSCWMQNFNRSHEYAAQFDDLAHQYALYRKLMAHWRNVIGDRILDVLYEDLVRDPEREMSRILQWLGLSPADYSIEASDSRKIVTTASAWQVRQPIHQDSIERWRAYEQFLTPLKLALLDHDLDPTNA